MTLERPSFRGRRFVRASALGLTDQALVSAANFVTMIVLARELVPSEFGAFVLAYTGLLLLNGLQTAFVTQPHNVLGQSREAQEYPAYTKSTVVGQLLFIAPFAALALAAAALTLPFSSAAAAILLALVPAIVGWQLQEFGRRVLYTEGRLGAALVADCLSYGGQVAALVLLASSNSLTPARALYVVALTSFVGAVYAFWMIRASLRGRYNRGALAENWAFGKWLGAAIGASWFSGHLYIYLAALMLGPPAAGAMKAAQVILGPLNSFFLFLFTLLPIRFAGTREARGDVGLHSDLRRAFVLTTPPVVVYCALAALFAGPLLELLYGETYAGYADVVILFAAYYFVMHLVNLLTAALSARRQTRALFWGSAYAGMTGLLLGWAFVELWDVEGAVAGMIVGALVVAGSFARSYRRDPAVPSAPARTDAAAVIPQA